MLDVPGMKNFFGKKLGGYVFNAFSHLSPQNIGSGAIRNTIESAYAKSGMMGAGKVAMGRIVRGLSTAKKHGYTFGDWFTGLNIGEKAADVSEHLRHTRAAWRIGTGVTVGVAGLSSAMGSDNFLGVTARSAIQLGGHTAIAGAIGSVSPWGGAAYAGVTALNALRPGDNFGPF